MMARVDGRLRRGKEWGGVGGKDKESLFDGKGESAKKGILGEALRMTGTGRGGSLGESSLTT